MPQHFAVANPSVQNRVFRLVEFYDERCLVYFDHILSVTLNFMDMKEQFYILAQEQRRNFSNTYPRSLAKIDLREDITKMLLGKFYSTIFLSG